MGIDISIVIPVLNERVRLETCLEQLGRQTLDVGRFEILVVDNGSTDGTYEFALGWPGLRVLRQRGPAPDPYLARNAGVGAARGEVIVFTDAHCAADERWLSLVWRSFFEDCADIAAGPLDYPADASRSLRLYGAYHQSKMGYIFGRRIDSSLFCHGGNLAIRKSLFEACGGFLPLPAPGDTELIQRVRRRSDAKIRYLPDAVVRRSGTKTLTVMLTNTARHAKLNRVLSDGAAYRTLSWRHRRELFRAHRRDNKLSWYESLLLAFVLVSGVVVYQGAQLQAKWFGT